jgi:hypothetical protein
MFISVHEVNEIKYGHRQSVAEHADNYSAAQLLPRLWRVTAGRDLDVEEHLRVQDWANDYRPHAHLIRDRVWAGVHTRRHN